MLAKIQKWGNSQGLRLAKHLLADAHIDVGDEVDIAVKDGNIIISPAKNRALLFFAIVANQRAAWRNLFWPLC